MADDPGTHRHHPHQHAPHVDGVGAGHAAARGAALHRVTLSATLHCLTGCAIGEVAGMVIGTALGLGNGTTVVLSTALAFVAGFSLTALPFLRRGMPPAQAARIAFAADAASITVMEIVDNVLMLFIPGAMAAPLSSSLFWGSLALSLAVAGVAAYPVNRWLIARGKGHAVVHARH